MPVAVITGGSRGLGRALAAEFVRRGFHTVIDGRDDVALSATADELRHGATAEIVAVPGDISDPVHQRRLVEVATELGGIDVLVNNASMLGPSPQPTLAEYPLDTLRQVYETNVIAPIALTQRSLDLLRAAGGTVINVTSDAAVEPYEGWGGYGSSKAALDQSTRILGAEEPSVHVYAVDPGDMRTQMHQEAFPNEDISDRPLPEASVPGFFRLLDTLPPSGHYRVSELAPVETSSEAGA